MILPKVIEKANAVQCGSSISGSQTLFRIIEKRGQTVTPFANLKQQGLEIALPADLPAEQVQKISAIVEETRSEVNEAVEVQIAQKLSVGTRLPNFGQVKKVFEEGTVELAAKEGQVLLIDVWATWCGPCQKPMQHNQHMLEVNNWGDKVRLVGVSVDDSAEVIVQRVNSKGWNKVEHLTLGGWNNEHPLIKGFGVTGIPFVALADTHGKLVFTGHPSEIDLENKIKELINEKEEKPAPAANAGHVNGQKVLGVEELTKISATLGDKEFFDEHFGQLNFISTKLILQMTAANGKLAGTAKIQVYVNKQDEEVLKQYEKMLPADVDFNGKVVEIAQVPEVPQACSGCKQELNYPLYWCRWSLGHAQFRCRECVEKKEGDYGFVYKSNSVLLTVPTKQVGSYCLGHNLQPAADANLSILDPHSFMCNGGCGAPPGNVGKARYISVGARTEPNYRGDYIDVCEDCLFKYLDKDEQVSQALSADGHAWQHPFLRILYNTNGYYKF